MAWPRLTFVIGKGGAGKSTVSTALAIRLADLRPTILADLDQRGSAKRMLQVDRSESEMTRAGEGLELCSLNPRRELQRFIQRIVPVRMISDRMLGSRTFSYVTAALPGLQAFLLLTRLSSLAGEAARADRYVVVDGLSTGASLELLSVAMGVRNLAAAGTLNRLAGELESFISDPNRFGAAIVVSPQELALKEGLEAAARLRDNLHVKRVIAILNGVPAPLFTKAETEHAMAADAEHAGLVRRRMELDEAARGVRKELAAAGLEVIELPMLFTAAVGKAEVVRLSHSLKNRVVA
ncbi:MAG: ArsA-related P-loop ATPase [Candidatus Binataceae bacterium]